MKKKMRILTAAVLVLALFASGCGRSGADGSDSDTSRDGSQGGRQIDKDRVYREERLKLEADHPLADPENIMGGLHYRDGRVRTFGIAYGESDEVIAEPEEDDSQEEEETETEGTPDETNDETDDNAPEPEDGVAVINTFFSMSFLPDGSDVQIVVLDEYPGGRMWYSSPVPGEDGTSYCVRTVYPENYGKGEEDVIVFNAIASSTMPAAPAAAASNEVTEGEQEDAGDDADDVAQTDNAAADSTAQFAAQTSDDADDADEDGNDTGEEDDDNDFDRPITPPSDDDEYEREHYFLIKYGAEGEVVWETELLDENSEWYSVGSIAFVDGAGIAVSDTRGISLYDAESGTYARNLYDEEEWVEMLQAGNGELYFRTWSQEEQRDMLVHLPVAEGAQKEDIPISDVLANDAIYYLRRGNTTDFIIADSVGVYTWNVGDESPTLLFTYIDSDLAMESMDTVVQISDTELIGYYYYWDENGGGRFCSRLTKVDPADVKDKEVLTLGCFWLDSDIRRAVLRYNKEDHDCRISVTDYARESNDYESMMSRMNTDIISGNAPDIMILSSEMKIESYEAKGVFEPLDSYMAADPDISAQSYMDNVFDAYRYKDQLYLLIPSFSVRTYAIKQKDADQVSRWDLATLTQLARDKSIDFGYMFGYPMTGDALLAQALIFDSRTYVDWSAQQARFDSAQFLDLLNLAKEFPTEDMFDPDWWENDHDAMYRNDEALIAQCYIGSFGAYSNMKHGQFGEDIALVGFPREDGTGGSTVMANAQLAMSASSHNKEGCWAFLRMFLLEEFQSQYVNGWSFPVLRSQMEAKLEKAKQRPSYVDERTGEQVYYDDTYYINGQEIIIPPLSEEEAKELMTFFDSLNASYNYDETVMNIVSEETAAFFKGQKRAEEVAQIIQSRVQIYIDENS